MSILQKHGILQQTVKKSVTINAENESIQLASGDFDSLLDGTNPFSISMWVKPSTIDDAGLLFSNINENIGDLDGIALTNGGSAAPNRLSYYLIDDFDGGFFNPTNFIRRDFIHTMNNNVWYHIVATYDGSADISGLTVYQDAVSLNADTAADSNSGFEGGSIDNPGELSFGGGPVGGNAFQGKYTEITIWDIELSQSQVNALYNNGKPGNPRLQINPNNLRMWLRIDEDLIFHPTCRNSEGEATATYINIPVTDITTDVP